MKIEISCDDVHKMLDRDLPHYFKVFYSCPERFQGRKMTVTARMRLQNFQTHSKHE